jgi:hypothetical protein
MIKNSSVEILETAEYGPVLKFRDAEVADQFEDFLTERCFVLFQTKLAPEETIFIFGQASALSRVHDLYEKFTYEIMQNDKAN